MEDTLAGHSAAYSETLQAGRHLHESAKEVELQDRLQTELQDLEKAWKESQSRLERGRDLAKARAQVRYQLTVHHIKDKMSPDGFCQMAQNTPVFPTRRLREEKPGTVRKKWRISPDKM